MSLSETFSRVITKHPLLVSLGIAASIFSAGFGWGVAVSKFRFDRELFYHQLFVVKNQELKLAKDELSDRQNGFKHSLALWKKSGTDPETYDAAVIERGALARLRNQVEAITNELDELKVRIGG